MLENIPGNTPAISRRTFLQMALAGAAGGAALSAGSAVVAQEQLHKVQLKPENILNLVAAEKQLLTEVREKMIGKNKEIPGEVLENGQIKVHLVGHRNGGNLDSSLKSEESQIKLVERNYSPDSRVVRAYLNKGLAARQGISDAVDKWLQNPGLEDIDLMYAYANYLAVEFENRPDSVQELNSEQRQLTKKQAELNRQMANILYSHGTRLDPVDIEQIAAALRGKYIPAGQDIVLDFDLETMSDLKADLKRIKAGFSAEPVLD